MKTKPNKEQKGTMGPETTRTRMNTTCLGGGGVERVFVAQRLKGIMAQYSLDLLFLNESKNQDDKVHDVVMQLGYDNVKCVSSHGIGGGLALLW